jgi:hypothetical protein
MERGMRANQGFILAAGLLGAQLLSAGAQGAPGAKAACERIAEILAQLPFGALERFPGSVPNPLTGIVRAGCRLELRGNFDPTGGAQHPLAQLTPEGSLFSGWSFDHRYAADGPDGTAFALRRDRVLCLVTGSWDGGNGSNPDDQPEDWYEISVGCTTD